MNQIEVTVICIAYNHEKYIRNALDGFVNQKTNFQYEVLIHDDASTDNTAKIIREFEEKYPDKIIPIYQTENQYSKNVGIIQSILLPLAKGKYIALCEGDDYWTDSQKLQKQFDFMESHDDASACFHNGLVINVKSEKKTVVPNVQQMAKYSFDDIVMGRDGLFVTSSTFCRKEYYKIPDEFRLKGVGDFQLFVSLASNGTVYCLDDVMSTYVNGREGSWTEKVLSDEKLAANHRLVMVDLLCIMDKYYNYSHHDAFQYKIDWQLFQYFKLNKCENELKQKSFRKFSSQKNKKPLQRRIKKWIKQRFFSLHSNK